MPTMEQPVSPAPVAVILEKWTLLNTAHRWRCSGTDELPGAVAQPHEERHFCSFDHEVADIDVLHQALHPRSRAIHR